MTKIRGFEVAKGFEEQGVNLPERQTKNAAGYDFECVETVVVPPVWTQGVKFALAAMKGLTTQHHTNGYVGIKPTLVKTGVKAYMGEDEVLYLYNRSSNPMKRFLLMSNGTGVIDSDYYSNKDNDGHIMFQFINFGLTNVTIKKGERIGQGVFASFLKVDGEKTVDKVRKGGHGSTNE